MKDNKANIKYLLKFILKYKIRVVFLLILSLSATILSLLIPRLISPQIDSVFTGEYDQSQMIIIIGGIGLAILIITIIEAIIGSIVSEDVARDIRAALSEKISKQNFKFVNKIGPSKLLTNLTSDVDAIKSFISQGVLVVLYAVISLIGSGILLLSINWQLALPIILTVPVIALIFFVVFRFVSKYFEKQQEILDKLNLIINESIIGAKLIRVLNSQKYEEEKYSIYNQDSKEIGLKIVKLFSILFPFIGFMSNISILIIVWYGGNKIIDGELFYGDFTAFLSYVSTFITPILILGFVGNILARAFASLGRISKVLDSEVEVREGELEKDLIGQIEFKDVSLELSKKIILNNISFNIKPKTKTAIIGPTASGKTQIFYLMSKLIEPTSGEIYIDGEKIEEYSNKSFYKNLGLVFQDSVIFNTSLEENIGFDKDTKRENIEKAIDIAELRKFVENLPDGIQTKISERGTTLSGGQKQRVTLARALSINPSILLLDDFTARVDIKTEKKILENIDQNYKNITIISITQKIDPIKDYDKIIFIMEGNLIGEGKHEELLESCLEYKQLYQSQQTT